MQLSEVRISLCDTGAVSNGSSSFQNSQGVGANGGAPHGHSSSAPSFAGTGSRLKAFCSLTFDNTFVIRDVKLIEGNDGLFLAMPSRKLCDRCRRCGEKNHLKARYCNSCGARLNESRYLQYQNHNGPTRLKLHADIAHPINAQCRSEIEQRVLRAYQEEIERSKQPGYVPHRIDGDFVEDWIAEESNAGHHEPLKLRPTGTHAR